VTKPRFIVSFHHSFTTIHVVFFLFFSFLSPLLLFDFTDSAVEEFLLNLPLQISQESIQLDNSC